MSEIFVIAIAFVIAQTMINLLLVTEIAMNNQDEDEDEMED